MLISISLWTRFWIGIYIYIYTLNVYKHLILYFYIYIYIILYTLFMQVPSCGLGLTMFDHQFAARSRKSLNCSVKSSRPMATGSCWNQEISPSGGNVLWLEGADKKRLLIAWQPESNGPIYPWVSLNGGVAKDLELGKRSRFMYILYCMYMYGNRLYGC